MMNRVIALLLGLLISAATMDDAMAHVTGQEHAHEPDGLIKGFDFWPDYTLGQNAHNYPGPRVHNPVVKPPIIAAASDDLRLYGQPITERYEDLITGDDLPSGAFTVELWVTVHVNQPIGVVAGVFGGDAKRDIGWVLGYYDKAMVFGVPGDDGHSISIEVPQADLEGFHEYWHHLIGTYDGRVMRLYHNGEMIAMTDKVPAGVRGQGSFDVAAFLQAEPYMRLENTVRYAALYDRALTADEIRAEFERHADLIEDGRLFENMFHFTAGPYLNLPTKTGINVLWETDRPAQGRIEWGESLPLTHSQEFTTPNRLQEVTLTGLKTDTPYLYRVVAVEESGAEIDSGLLTFRTAVADEQPFTFAIIGDTEARPYINDRVAKAVWGERPNFAMVLGDLTDGGTKENRFQWTHEYFQGMTQLFSRIPNNPVPGNGEGDVYWYNYYHRLPGVEHYYTFTYGNTQFFMLDSNLVSERRATPEERAAQRRWLEAELKKSTARWKIAAHHYPIYTSDENDYGDTWKGEKSTMGDERVRDDFLDLYEKYGVDLVLFGHLHTYERSWPVKNGAVNLQDGVIYVQAGGGGGNTEDFAPTHNWFSRKTYRGHHYGLFSVAGDHLSFSMVDTEGHTRDRFELVKGKSGRGVLLGVEK